MAATAKYSITTNTYWRYTVVLTETSTNAINNTSAVTAKVYVGRTGNASYITGADISGSVTIDGTKKTYHYTKSGRVDVAVGDTSLLIATITFTVDHDSDGEKVATWSSEFDNNVSGANPSGGSFSGRTITLTDIDRSAPTITFTAGTITANSFKISAYSTYTCDTWQYSINGGTSYTTFSTTSGTSKTYTVTGLSPATSYSVKVRATRTHNDVRGTSSTKTVKTIGNSIINSVGAIQLDNPNGATGTLNMTIYVASYKHKLEMYVADTLVYTVPDIVKPTGSQTYTFTIPSSTLSTIYGLMPNSASATATYKLYSYDGSTQIGNVSSKTGTIKLSQSYSAPTFDNTPSYTFSDTNAITANLTGNNQLMVQGYSNLSVVASSATAKNGASIASYSVAINGETVSSNTTAVSFGAVNVSGDITVSVSATDTRGFTTTATGLITVIPYQDVRIDDLTFARVNNFEEYCNVALDGYFSPINVNGTAKNTTTSLQYRKKKTTDTAWGSWVAISPTINVSLFSYDNDNFETLDRNFAWDFQFEVSDELSSYTISALILEGIPTMSLRKNKAGINNPNPAYPLDVNGAINGTGVGTALKQAILDFAYPIGTLYYTVSADLNTAEKMSAYFGGTWVAWGMGRTPLGLGTSEANDSTTYGEYAGGRTFTTVERKGGSIEETLTVAQMQQHRHSWSLQSGQLADGSYYSRMVSYSSSLGSGGVTSYSGEGEAHNNVSPYQTCYIWKRTA